MFVKGALLTMSLLMAIVSTAATPAPTPSNSSTTTYCVPHEVTPEEQSKIFAAFVQEFYVVRDVAKAFELYIVADYIQHNPYEPPYGKQTDGQKATLGHSSPAQASVVSLSHFCLTAQSVST